MLSPLSRVITRPVLEFPGFLKSYKMLSLAVLATWALGRPQIVMKTSTIISTGWWNDWRFFGGMPSRISKLFKGDSGLDRI